MACAFFVCGSDVGVNLLSADGEGVGQSGDSEGERVLNRRFLQSFETTGCTTMAGIHIDPKEIGATIWSFMS